MKILVTGASGAIAQETIGELLKKNVEVIATSRDPAKMRRSLYHGKIKYLPYDIDNPSDENLFLYFDKPDSVIHLAWDLLSEPTNSVHTTTILESNKQFLYNLIANGLKDVNGIGTAYEYGLKEGLLSENTVAEPVVAYGKAKNELRIWLEGLQNVHAFSLKWIRIFNVFSPGREGKNLFSALNKAISEGSTVFNMSGGEQVRDYLSAGEVAKRLAAIATQTNVLGTINCCSGKPIRLVDLIRDYLRSNQLDIKLNLGYYPYLAYEPMKQWGTTTKLEQVLKSE